MLYTKKKKNASFIVFGITVETRFTDICYGYLSITDISADNWHLLLAQSTDSYRKAILFSNAVTSLSTACCNRPFVFEGKKPLVDGCVDVSSQRYSTPDRIICRRKLDYFGIKWIMQ